MDEVDEFGIPIKKPAVAKKSVDEFGIPIKKKDLQNLLLKQVLGYLLRDLLSKVLHRIQSHQQERRLRLL